MKRFLFKVTLALLAALAGMIILKATGASGRPFNSPAKFPEQPQADAWTWRGPQHDTANLEAPLVNSILIDPTNPAIVYAGTNQGVYRSADGGESWEARNQGLGAFGDLVVTSIALHPGNPQTLVIGTWGYGLYASTDGGAHWSPLSDPLQPAYSQASRASADSPPEIRAGGASYGYPLHPPAGSRQNTLPARTVSRLTHETTSQPLQAAGLPQSLPWTPVRRVAIHPDNPLEIYASLDSGYGLYRSQDGGASWSKVNVGSGSAHTYAFAPSNHQIRYASFTAGVYRSLDGGATWAQVGAGSISGSPTGIAIHPLDAQIVLVGTLGGGLYRTTDGGASWEKVSEFLAEVDFYSVAFAPSNPDIVYAGGYDWLYVSIDAGGDWMIADETFPVYYIEGLAVHPQLHETVLIGTNEYPWGGVYKRSSIGSSFELKAKGMEDTFILDLEQDPGDPNRLYAAAWGAGVFRSSDGGLSWEPKYGAPYIYSLEATQGVTGTILYATTFYSDWGILVSYDQGEIWDEVSRGYTSDISFDLLAVKGDPQNLVAATIDGIQYSQDGGQTWADASGLDQGTVLRLCEFPGTGRLLAATYGGGIFYSADRLNWSEANTGIPAGNPRYTYGLHCSPGTPGLAYAGSLGVYTTSDYGEHWQPMSKGLPNDYIRAIDSAAGSGDVFAASQQSGVYLSPQGRPAWFAANTNLSELRTLSIQVTGASPGPHVWVGTYGRGAWEYVLTVRPTVIEELFIPFLFHGYAPPASSGAHFVWSGPH